MSDVGDAAKRMGGEPWMEWGCMWDNRPCLIVMLPTDDLERLLADKRFMFAGPVPELTALAVEAIEDRIRVRRDEIRRAEERINDLERQLLGIFERLPQLEEA